MPDLVGRTLKNPKSHQNQYYLRRLVGSGATSDVYEAFDTARFTSMAVKVLRRDVAANPVFFHAFEKEAGLLEELRHPNIVRLYEFGRDGEVVFIVMEWVDGSDLRQVMSIRRAPFSLDEVSGILEPVAVALGFAHQMKPAIYHCDVKPANILMQGKGQHVLLTDFGVARLASEEAGGGTVPYMAPEQFTAGVIGPCTDVYALGVTTYQMLSGGPVPFPGDTHSPGNTTRERIAWEHIHKPLPDLRQYNSGLSQAVVTSVERALNKDPRQRYASAVEFSNTFQKAAALKVGTGDAYGTVGLPPPVPRVNRQPVANPVPDATRVSPRGIRRGTSYLFGRSGERAGQLIPIPREGLTIGRGTSCQIRLLESSVSRVHATVIWTPRKIYIRDDQSRLGTWVNGVQIPPGQPVPLGHGDVIKAGYEQVFEFREK